MSADLMVCEWCGGDVDPATICPLSIACPVCTAKAGQKCKRPSGHRAPVMHSRRWEEAEMLDRLAALAGAPA